MFSDNKSCQKGRRVTPRPLFLRIFKNDYSTMSGRKYVSPSSVQLYCRDSHISFWWVYNIVWMSDKYATINNSVANVHDILKCHFKAHQFILKKVFMSVLQFWFWICWCRIWIHFNGNKRFNCLYIQLTSVGYGWHSSVPSRDLWRSSRPSTLQKSWGWCKTRQQRHCLLISLKPRGSDSQHCCQSSPPALKHLSH